MIQGLMQKVWSWIAPKFPNSNQVLEKAKSMASQGANVAAIMGAMEQYAKQNNLSTSLDNNQIWNSFKAKSPDEIIPHAQNTMKEMGKLPTILSFFMGNKTGGQQ